MVPVSRLLAWVHKETGQFRAFHEREYWKLVAEGFSPDTHDLRDPCPPEMLDGAHDWNAEFRMPVLVGAPDVLGPPVQAPLSTMHEALYARIDHAAGEFRKRFITTVPGQEMTYLHKEREARTFMMEPEGAYPMLEAEAAATGVAVADLASAVIASADAWVGIGAKIEAARIGAKKAVADATTAEAKSAAAAVDWAQLLV